MSNEILTHKMGWDGMTWFMGVIESTDDPLQIGRAKVRIIGAHDIDATQLSTFDLPWSYPLMPVTQSRVLPDYRIGDWVIGFFMDGKLGQQPVILGVLPSVPQRGGIQRS